MSTQPANYVDCVQGSPEWLQMRCGSVTASRVADVIAKLKNGTSSTARANYLKEVVCERLTGRVQDHYCSFDMQRGIELEPLARAAYEIKHDVMVGQIGLVLHPTINFAGASPDGLVGADGMLEIKCPRATTHLEWWLAGVVPEEHRPQMLFQLACAERQWNDFCSYCPEMPDHLQLFVVRFPRDDKRIEDMEKEVIAFNAEVDAVLQKLNATVSG